MVRKVNKVVKIASEREIVISSLKVAIVVGLILNLINQGEKLIALDFKHLNLLKFFITFSVPYMVSTYASVKVKLASERS
ncbi:nitrate/nitrite transporter NrtS [Oceanihabitans sp. 1_MG-2023]|uniref:nitrate/nitrite transporter NrtS n=1 Tax=Flavobacteriaceae TaxID=49546 RepID=UPI00209173C8|nr:MULTISPECIES: nitrate/nitrite transporter NrtS [Flavobacteriaceae]MDO6621268.1 nitrate/nitrite transporter NrtS [Oceanihabitans sp. 1_MG-2023]